MKIRLPLLLAIALGALAGATVHAQTITPAVQTKIDAKVKEIAAWAADPAIVDAVRAQNAAFPAEYAAMTQEKWTALTVLDPFVRSFSKNSAGTFLKAKKDDLVTLPFLSDAAGYKVAFTAKTTNWCHKGMPKHDVPMTGKTWQGPIEVNQASGQQQIQVAVPVLDGGKPIGSLVVGLSFTKLSQ
jgi:hypothetical protein